MRGETGDEGWQGYSQISHTIIQSYGYMLKNNLTYAFASSGSCWIYFYLDKRNISEFYYSVRFDQYFVKVFDRTTNYVRFPLSDRIEARDAYLKKPHS